MGSGKPSNRSQPFPWRVHPIWRSIGCLMLIIVPIMAISLADFILEQVQMPSFGIWAQSVELPLFGEVEFILARAIVSIVLMGALFLLFSVFGSLIYSWMGGLRDEDIASFTGRNPYDR